MHEKLIAELEEKCNLAHFEIDTAIANGSYHNCFGDAIAALREADKELKQLRAELSTQETLVATLQEQKYEWEELQSELSRLRKEIEDAPHAYRCEIGNITTPKKCTCWKRNALSDKTETE